MHLIPIHVVQPVADGKIGLDVKSLGEDALQHLKRGDLGVDAELAELWLRHPFAPLQPNLR